MKKSIGGGVKAAKRNSHTRDTSGMAKAVRKTVKEAGGRPSGLPGTHKLPKMPKG